MLGEEAILDVAVVLAPMYRGSYGAIGGLFSFVGVISAEVGTLRLLAGRTFARNSLGSLANGSPGLVLAGEVGGSFGFLSGMLAKSRLSSGRLGMIDVAGFVRRAVGLEGIVGDLEDVGVGMWGGDDFVEETRTRNLGSFSFFILGSLPRDLL